MPKPTDQEQFQVGNILVEWVLTNIKSILCVLERPGDFEFNQ